MTATQTWRDLLARVGLNGKPVSHGARAHAPRSSSSVELIACKTTWDMSHPVITCPERKIGRRFMAAEAAWILSGDNRLSTILPYAKHMKDFSVDGLSLSGAYGPPFLDQLPYVVSCLRRDPQSRQAVATLWRPRPGSDPDIPCTIALQWLVRSGRLTCVVSMRSSDMYLGLPYDVFSFSAMSAAVALDLNVPVELGDLHVVAGSQHLYERDREAAARCSGCKEDPPSWHLDLESHGSRNGLLADLWAMAREGWE